MCASQTNGSLEHLYEEIRPPPCTINNGYLTPVSENENSETDPKFTEILCSPEPRYVSYDGNVCKSPIRKANITTDKKTEQTHALLRQEVPYSDPSQTYLKTPVENASNESNHTNELSTGVARSKSRKPLLLRYLDYLPATADKETQSERTTCKSRGCQLKKLRKRNVITAISICLNLFLVLGLIYTLYSLLKKPPDVPEPPIPDPGHSRLKRSVCFYCTTGHLEHLGVFHNNSYLYSQFYVFNDQEGQKLCCMDNAEHLHWLITMAQVRILSDKNRDRRTASHYVYRIFSPDAEKTTETGITQLSLRNKYLHRSTEQDSFKVPEDGFYFFYLFLTVQLNHSLPSAEVSAKIKRKSQAGVIHTLSQESHTIVGDCRYPISVFRISKLLKGDILTFLFTHPSDLYNWTNINYAGIVKL